MVIFRRFLSVAVVAAGLGAQSFEVAVIKPSAADPGGGTSVQVFEGGRFRVTNEPVKLLLRQAFQLQNAEIAGGPAWIETDRYDIEAKTGNPGKPTPTELSPRLQSLLAERFHLQFHREARELTVDALVVGGGGPKLKPKSEGAAAGTNTSGGSKQLRMDATAQSMEMLAGYVGNRLGRIVVDKTGLRDTYDFTLQ